MSANHAYKWQQNNEESVQHDQKVTVKVKKRGWITRGEKLIYSVFSAGLIIAGAFIVNFSSSTDALNREIQTLEQTVQNQQMYNESILLESKELSRPERILQIAKDNGLSIQNSEVVQTSKGNR